jgi:hypothetical protein
MSAGRDILKAEVKLEGFWGKKKGLEAILDLVHAIELMGGRAQA